MSNTFIQTPDQALADGFAHHVVRWARESDAPERTAVLFYGATLLVISVVITTMTVYVARRREVLKDGVTSDELRRLTRRTRPTPAFYAAILILALLAPRAAVWMFLVVAVTSALIPDLPKGERRTPP